MKCPVCEKEMDRDTSSISVNKSGLSVEYCKDCAKDKEKVDGLLSR